MTDIIIPIFRPPLVAKVLVKYSADIMELITEVENAANEMKLLISCGGYAGNDTTLSK